MSRVLLNISIVVKFIAAIVMISVCIKMCNLNSGHSEWYTKTMKELREQNRQLDSMNKAWDKQKPYRDSMFKRNDSILTAVNKRLRELLAETTPH